MGVYDIGDDPASEDDMDDYGMSRYMETDDEEGWDWMRYDGWWLMAEGWWLREEELMKRMFEGE